MDGQLREAALVAVTGIAEQMGPTFTRDDAVEIIAAAMSPLMPEWVDAWRQGTTMTTDDYRSAPEGFWELGQVAWRGRG